MESTKFNRLMNSSLALLLGGAVMLLSCQESSHKDDNEKNATDSAVTGLEGTRDQAAQVGGADVKMDTSAGQAGEKSGGTGGQPGGRDSSSRELGNNAEFISEAISGNSAEVRFAKLALQNSSNNEIKAVARLLDKDHTAALGQLKAMAARKKISIPAEETADLKNKVNELSAKKGSEFDKPWCEMLMEKHKTTISKYEDMAKNTTDQELKNWINKTLPKIRIHHDKLMACHSKLS